MSASSWTPSSSTVARRRDEVRRPRRRRRARRAGRRAGATAARARAVSPRRSASVRSDRLEATGGRAREEAAATRWRRRRSTRPPTADVEHCAVLSVRAAARAPCRTPTRSIALDREPRLASHAAWSRSTVSRRTATTTTRVRAPAAVSTSPSDCKSSTASSIGIGMWSGADASDVRRRAPRRRRHDRQVQRARDDPLVGDAEPHAAGQLVLGEERPQLLGQRLRVGDFAVTQDARAAARTTAPRVSETEPFAVGDGGGDVAGVELEPDDGGWGLLSPEHEPVIGRRAPRP